MEETVMATSDLVACTLTDAARRDRREEISSTLTASIIDVRETTDAFELGFPSEAIEIVRAFVDFERRCCRFLAFKIDDRDDQTWLRLSGPQGTKEYIRGWLPKELQGTQQRSGRLFKASGGSLPGAVGAIVSGGRAGSSGAC